MARNRCDTASIWYTRGHSVRPTVHQVATRQAQPSKKQAPKGLLRRGMAARPSGLAALHSGTENFKPNIQLRGKLGSKYCLDDWLTMTEPTTARPITLSTPNQASARTAPHRLR